MKTRNKGWLDECDEGDDAEADALADIMAIAAGSERQAD
jgi:hypothetical protein